MYIVGQPSWRIGSSVNSALPHAALYIREACALEVPSNLSNPPTLLGEVTDHSEEMSSQSRAEAGKEWLEWWMRIVAFEGRNERGLPEPPADHDESLRAHREEWEALFHWPESDAIGESSALRRAAQVCGREPSRFRTGWNPPRRGHSDALAFHNAYSRVVESLVARLGVSPDRLRAGVIVLSVEGDWSNIALPGVLLCSVRVAQDVERIAPLVEAAFLSGLEAD